MPEWLDGREADNWAALFAVADAVGAGWDEKAREAAQTLAGNTQDGDTVSEMLLADLRDLFGDFDRMSSEALLRGLHGLTERPWGEWARSGKPMTARGLAALLKPFGVESRSVRLPDGTTPKGFHREQLEDAWGRYLPRKTPPLRHTATERENTGRNAVFDAATDSGRGGYENAVSSSNDAACGDVADGKPPKGPEGDERLRCPHCPDGGRVMSWGSVLICAACHHRVPNDEVGSFVEHDVLGGAL
jgi:hypothetical protein